MDMSPYALGLIQPSIKPKNRGIEEKCESGIDSCSSSSTSTSTTSLESVEGLANPQPLLKLPIVTAATQIRPLTSNRNADQFSSIDGIVIFRGHLPILNPVPTDRNARMKLMKMYAKRVQNDQDSRFLRMNIDGKGIKLYELDNDASPLLKIDGCYLDLVKQSRKDTAFFYFTTSKAQFDDNPLMLKSTAPSEAPECYSGYDCFVFHGTSTRVADRAHRLLRQFVEENTVETKPKAGFFNLVLPAPSTATSSLAHETLLCEPRREEEKAAPSPQHAYEDEKKFEDDLLLCDFTTSGTASSAVSMFDSLLPSSTESKNVPVKHELDLLDDFLAPPPQADNSFFAAKHLNYSMQMANNIGMQTLPNMAPISSAVPLAGNTMPVPGAMAPSLLPHLKPKSPAMLNPFQASQPMAPLVPSSMSVPMRAQIQTNPFSVAANSSAPTIAATNPFGLVNQSNALPRAYPQYSNLTSNPFVAASPKPAKSFDNGFDDFLSQTVKSQFKSTSNLQ